MDKNKMSLSNSYNVSKKKSKCGTSPVKHKNRKVTESNQSRVELIKEVIRKYLWIECDTQNSSIKNLIS
jgi:hypothetical protein